MRRNDNLPVCAAMVSDGHLTCRSGIADRGRGLPLRSTSADCALHLIPPVRLLLSNLNRTPPLQGRLSMAEFERPPEGGFGIVTNLKNERAY